MKFINHPQHTRSLGAPPSWDHSKIHCGSLSISDKVAAGYPFMESAWVPEGFEGARLALGEAHVRLAIYSQSHPPVSMVVHFQVLERRQLEHNLQKHLEEVLAYAKQEGYLVQLVDGVVGVFDSKLGAGG